MYAITNKGGGGVELPELVGGAAIAWEKHYLVLL